jgi:mono/diheme cytochrome c family protein
MRRAAAPTIVVVSAVCLIHFALRQNTSLDQAARAQTVQGRVIVEWPELTGEALVRHGEYLVVHVAMCIQCHSPHNDDGSPNRERLLEGAPIPLQSPFPRQVWAFQAPALAGLPGGWSEEQLVRFLQTGETPNGHPAQPPMPPFRLTEQDARAVAAYLHSLRPTK